MHLMYTLNEEGKRIYTLKVRQGSNSVLERKSDLE